MQRLHPQFVFPVLLLKNKHHQRFTYLRYLRRLLKTFHKNSNAAQYIRRGSVELCGGLRMPMRAIPIIWPTRQNSMELSTSSKIIWIHFLTVYRPVRKKYDSFRLKIFSNKKFWKTFYFFTCILPDYVAHDITKEFWKNSHSENMTAGFLLRCQNWLWYEISLIWHWNVKLLMQNWSFVYGKVPNDDQNVI